MGKIENINKGNAIREKMKKIICSEDPFSYPFNNQAQDFLVFFEIDGYYLEENQYDALISAIKKNNEKGFYMSIIEGVEDEEVDTKIFGNGIHWWCELPTYGEYSGVKLPLLELAIFSENGTWGMLISHEMHAIIGGELNFINDLKCLYPNWEEEFNAFLSKDWVDSELFLKKKAVNKNK